MKRLLLLAFALALLSACYEPENSFKTVLSEGVWVHETELTDEFGNYDWPKSYFQFETDGTFKYWSYELRSNGNLLGNYSVADNKISGSFAKIKPFRASTSFTPSPLFLGEDCTNPLGENNFEISSIDINEAENIVRADVLGLNSDCEDDVLVSRTITMVKNNGTLANNGFLGPDYSEVTIHGDLTEILSSEDLATYQSFSSTYAIVASASVGPITIDNNLKNSYYELTGTEFELRFKVRNQLFGLIEDTEDLQSSIVFALVLLDSTSIELGDSRLPADANQIVVFDSDALMDATIINQSTPNVFSLLDIMND